MVGAEHRQFLAAVGANPIGLSARDDEQNLNQVKSPAFACSGRETMGIAAR
jgi:hypothetical protein